jgi:hypothetical protein
MLTESYNQVTNLGKGANSWFSAKYTECNPIGVQSELSLFRNLPVTVLLPGLHCPADGGMLFQNP